MKKEKLQKLLNNKGGKNMNISKPMPRPIAVEYLYGWNLLVTFDNGEKKVCNCDDIPTSTRECDKPLQDINYFKKAFINDLTLAWDEDLEVCPDGLYKESIPYKEWLEQQKNNLDK